MKLLSGAAAAVLLWAGAAEAASFQDGLTAYNANRVAEAERTYAAIIADPAASMRERSLSARELGRIAWLIDRDLDRALAYLERAADAGDERCSAAALQVRFLREARQAARAVEAGTRLVAVCDDPVEADLVRLHAAHAGLDAAAALEGTERATALGAVEAELERLSETGRTRLAASQARLGLGLLRGDARTSLEGWKEYFWLSGTDAPQGLAAWQGRVTGVFEKALAANAPAPDQAVLTELLVRAGFHMEARRLAADTKLEARAADDPAYQRAAAYFRFRDGIDRVTLDLNRRLARGGSKSGAEFEREVKRLMNEALTAVGVRFSPTAMTEQFGVYGTIGETSGYPSIHAGHLVQDERRPVAQYGRSGEIRFIAVDNMIANGFESWLWDGSAQTGGWASDGATIVQVRPAYASGPTSAWLLTQDTPSRRRADARLPDFERRDLDALAASPVAYLPGLEERLGRQAILQIAERSARPGQGEAERRTAFLEEYMRAVVQHSIFIHEGRHVLDQASRERLKTEDLEYRAKLSELALADYPRLALAGIDADTIGSDTAHGKANSRIMRAYGEWLAAHAAEVPGFDPSKPALAQLDRMTDDQIRAVARSLDPWARP